MSYSRTQPTVYAVHWPLLNAFKIGSSDHQRWRGFLLRGGNLLALHTFNGAVDHYEFEHSCHLALWSTCRPAFNSAAEAEPYLGHGGGGYRECYMVPGDLLPQEILHFVDAAMDLHQAIRAYAREQCSVALPTSNGTVRTNGLTKNLFSPSRENVALATRAKNHRAAHPQGAAR